MLGFTSAIASDPQMKAIIDNPKVVASDLERLFLSVCEKKLDKAGENMIKLLVEYGRLALLPEVARAFEELKAQDEGVLEAEITAAAQPSDSEIKALVQRLETKFGKKIETSIKIDPEIIGGIKIVIGDTVIDASVRGQLQEMAYALKA
jgi:F-type H+-transporting ATPase subunit delta